MSNVLWTLQSSSLVAVARGYVEYVVLDNISFETLRIIYNHIRKYKNEVEALCSSTIISKQIYPLLETWCFGDKLIQSFVHDSHSMISIEETFLQTSASELLENLGEIYKHSAMSRK